MDENNDTKNVLDFIQPNSFPTVKEPFKLYKLLFTPIFRIEAEKKVMGSFDKLDEKQILQLYDEVEFEDNIEVQYPMDEIADEIIKLTFEKLIDGVNLELLGRQSKYYTVLRLIELEELMEQIKDSKSIFHKPRILFDLNSIKSYVEDKYKIKSIDWFAKIDEKSERSIFKSQKYFSPNNYSEDKQYFIFKELHKRLSPKIFLSKETYLTDVFIKNLYYQRQIKLFEYNNKSFRKCMMYLLFVLMDKKIIENFWEDKKKVIEAAMTVFKTKRVSNEYDNMRKAYDEINSSMRSEILAPTNPKLKLIIDQLDEILNELNAS